MKSSRFIKPASGIINSKRYFTHPQHRPLLCTRSFLPTPTPALPTALSSDLRSWLALVRRLIAPILQLAHTRSVTKHARPCPWSISTAGTARQMWSSGRLARRCRIALCDCLASRSRVGSCTARGAGAPPAFSALEGTEAIVIRSGGGAS